MCRFFHILHLLRDAKKRLHLLFRDVLHQILTSSNQWLKNIINLRNVNVLIIRKGFECAVRDSETQRNSTGLSTLLGIYVYSCMGKTNEIEGRMGRVETNEKVNWTSSSLRTARIAIYGIFLFFFFSRMHYGMFT